MLWKSRRGWSEVKLGRLFKGDCVEISPARGWVSNSQYLAHLGNHKKFCTKMESLIDEFGPLQQRLVFIDGLHDYDTG